MDEDFLDVTERGNAKKVALFLFIIVAFAVLGYFFVYQKYHFSIKNVRVEIGGTLNEDVKYYLKNKVVDTSGYKIDLSKVNTNEIGKYTYTVTYNNRTKKASVEVVDTTPPTFETQDLTVEVNDEDFFVGDFLKSCEDASKPCLVTFKNENDADKLNAVGDYEITILVSDIYDNKSETKVKLSVVAAGTLVDEKTSDLEYASSSDENYNFSGSYYLKLDKALDPEGEEARDASSNIKSDDIEAWVNENYAGYTLKSTEIIEIYNKSGYVIGYVVKVTINNGTDTTVYITK